MTFLNLINEAIKLDLDKQNFNKTSLSPFITNATMPITMTIDASELLFKHKIFAVLDDSRRRWFRGQLADENMLMKSGKFVICLLIDTGEIVTVSIRNLRPLFNERITKLKPLAKLCSLNNLSPCDPYSN